MVKKSSMINKLQKNTPLQDPARKDRFLRSYRKKTKPAQTNIMSIINAQFSYISLPVWGMSIAALLIALWGAHSNRDIIPGIAAFMPFVSGAAVFETFRSNWHGMAEIESVTLFSIRGVFFAKIVCIGSVNILLILLLSLIITPNSPYNFSSSGIMITIPYLISAAASLKAERSSFGRKSPLVCLVISTLTAGLVLAAFEKKIYFTEVHPQILNLLFVILIILLIYEIRKTFNWEEYVWN